MYVNLTARNDTGRLNTSPVTSMSPVVRLKWGCNHTITIPGMPVVLTIYSLLDNASVNSTCAQPPPPLGQLRGNCPPCQSRGWGICKCCTARGPGICQPPGNSQAFDTHAVSYQNITTRKVLLEEKQIGSFVMDRNKL